MKKTALCTLVILFVTANALCAQDFGWGPKLGFNSSRLTHSTKNNKAGLSVGGFVALPLSRSLEIEVSAMYSKQGANIDDKEIGVDGVVAQNVRMNIGYFNFPIVLKMYLIGGLNVYAGPQFSAMTSAKYKYDVPEHDMKVTKNVKSIMKNGDFALVLGAGYQFKFGLNASVNYNLGMVNTIKYQNLINDISSKTKNGLFQILVGWRF